MPILIKIILILLNRLKLKDYCLLYMHVQIHTYKNFIFMDLIIIKKNKNNFLF